jgi:hypothetical protein
MTETQELTLADIKKIDETDPKAADAALQRVGRVLEAREAEVREGGVKGTVAPSPTLRTSPGDLEIGDQALCEHKACAAQSAPTKTSAVTTGEEAAIMKAEVERLLGDLEIGPDEADEVIEDELDASDEDAVERLIAREEAYEAQDLLDEARKKRIELLEQLRATRAKINGGARVAPNDPLATEEKKVSNTLKKVGCTLTDLPSDFWKLPRIAKIPGERSRQNELHRVCAEAKRLRELEKRGRPANYDLLPFDEKLRIDANIRQRRHREKKRALNPPPSKPTVAPLPLANADMLSSTARHTMSDRLNIWTRASSTPLARQLRKPEQQRALIRAAAAYAWYFDRHSKPPSRSALAKMLRWTEDQVRRKLDVLKSLYAPGGPWAGA